MKEKRNKYVFRLLFLPLLVSMLLSGCGTQDESVADAGEEYTRELFAMGTYITMTAHGEPAEDALNLSEERIKELDALWSVTDESSDICKMNQSNGAPTEVSKETAEILQFALDMAGKTDGALDPTISPIITTWGFISGEHHIPTEAELKDLLEYVDYKKVSLKESVVTLPDRMQLELGAVGKGYTGDIISGLLKEQGVTSALLDLGGNIQAVGTKPDGSDWRIGLKNPENEGNLGVLSISDCAVVTSGNYERYFTGEDGKVYGHIINPKTGYLAESDLLSVTVISQEGKLCDALSTSLFVMGREKAAAYWRENQGFEMILVTENGEIYLTEGIKERFTLESDYSDWKVNVIGR